MFYPKRADIHDDVEPCYRFLVGSEIARLEVDHPLLHIGRYGREIRACTMEYDEFDLPGSVRFDEMGESSGPDITIVAMESDGGHIDLDSTRSFVES